MRFFALAFVVGCVQPQPQPALDGGILSHTFTATPDAIVSGGAVQITEPDDGDLANVASQNTPDEKLAKLIKKIVNQSPMFGIDPSILQANLTNGLLYASEANGTPNSGTAKFRMYQSRPGHVLEFLMTYNASWDGTHWNRDTTNENAWLFGFNGPNSSFGDDQIRFAQFDTASAAQWTDAQWNDAMLSQAGVAQNAGTGQIRCAAPIFVGSGGGAPAFQNSWANDATYEGLKFWKDPFGMVHITGYVKNGVGLTVFTLSAGYRPTVKPRMCNAVCPDGASPQAGYVTIDAATGVVQAQLAPSRSTIVIDCHFF